jgi:hypothetical protein
MKPPNILSALLPLLLSGHVLFAEEPDKIDEVRRAYSRMDYTLAEELALSKLEDESGLTVVELVEIHQILALIYYGQNSIVKARQAFRSALSLEPDLELDPVMVSPKILEFFATVKTDYLAEGRRAAASAIQYVKVYDPRPGAALRSMVLPGWGQYHKSQREKGFVLMTLWTLSASATIATAVMRSNAEDDYLSATSLPEINSSYRTFNRIHKLHQGALAITAATWGLAFFDALLVESTATRLSFGFHSQNHSLRMNFQLTF